MRVGRVDLSVDNDARASADADFSAFARARLPALARLGWALTGDRHSGEDLARSTLSRLWARWERVVEGGDPWPYTQAVAVNLAKTWRRRGWRGEVPAATIPDGEDVDGFSAEWRLTLETWLRRLPPRQRAAVVLRHLFDLSVDETAEVLGCSAGTVKSQTAKALAKLRAQAADLPRITGGDDAER